MIESLDKQGIHYDRADLVELSPAEQIFYDNYTEIRTNGQGYASFFVCGVQTIQIGPTHEPEDYEGEGATAAQMADWYRRMLAKMLARFLEDIGATPEGSND